MAVRLPIQILAAGEDDGLFPWLLASLRDEPVSLVECHDADGLLSLVAGGAPALVLLGHGLESPAVRDLCTRLRASSRPELPILLCPLAPTYEHLRWAFEWRASDVLPRPCGPAHLRTRLRMWLLRSGAYEVTDLLPGFQRQRWPLPARTAASAEES